MPRILLVEDEEHLAAGIRFNLENHPEKTAVEALANSSADAVPFLMGLAGADADEDVRAAAAWALSTHDTVTDLGPALAVGDRFVLFNQAVLNGNALQVSGGGVTWANDLAVDGSITVLSLAAPKPPPTTAIGVLSDGNLSLIATGAVGTAWSLHASNNVAGTVPWPVLTNGTITVSPFVVNDLKATNYTRRFYYFSAP